MMSNKLVTTATVLYTLAGLFVGFIVSWVIGWLFTSALSSVSLATGWILSIWLGVLIVLGLWAISLIPAMKTGMKALPMHGFIFGMWLAILVVFLVSLLTGLGSFHF